MKLIIRKALSGLAIFFLFSMAFFVLQNWVYVASKPTPRPTPDRRYTATPVQFIPYSDDLTALIDQIFIPADRGCRKVSDIGQLPKLNLVDATSNGRPKRTSIREIADSIYRSHRAYLISDDEPITHILIENVREKTIYELFWTSSHPNYYLRHAIWIGDQILAFEKFYGGEYNEILSINIVSNEVVYFAGVANCR